MESHLTPDGNLQNMAHDCQVPPPFISLCLHFIPDRECVPHSFLASQMKIQHPMISLQVILHRHLTPVPVWSSPKVTKQLGCEPTALTF